MESNKNNEKLVKIQLGKSVISVISGDIFKENTDIIVIPVDEKLSLQRQNSFAYDARMKEGK